MLGGRGYRRYPPGRAGASGVAPAASVHPGQSCSRHASVDGSLCGKILPLEPEIFKIVDCGISEFVWWIG